MKNFYPLIALILTTLASTSALAETERNITLTGKQLIHEMSFVGQKSRTLYRSEDYIDTCDRQVPATVYKYECDTRTVNQCETVPGSESCSSHPSCRDVTRQVCNSHGCTDVPTRECTNEESCHTTPPHEYCTSHQEQYNCGDRPYTEYHTEYYDCTKTRQVPIGTEITEDLTADVIVQFTGNFTGLSGKDTFNVSIANGLDVYRDDVAIALTHSEDTHFLKLKTLLKEKTSTGTKKSHLRVTYQVEVVPVSEALGMKTTITALDADRGHLFLDLAGAPLDANVDISFTSEKDKFLGGLETDHAQEVNGAKLKPTPLSGGQRISIPFNYGGGPDGQGRGPCLNRRPHVFKVKLTRKISTVLTEGLMNPKAAEKIGASLVSTFEKRLKLSGGKSPQCDSVR